MTGVIDGFRWAIVGSQPSPGFATAVSLGVGVAIFVLGSSYLRNVEQSMADVI